jgi:hypothetical protein
MMLETQVCSTSISYYEERTACLGRPGSTVAVLWLCLVAYIGGRQSAPNASIVVTNYPKASLQRE